MKVEPRIHFLTQLFETHCFRTSLVHPLQTVFCSIISVNAGVFIFKVIFNAYLQLCKLVNIFCNALAILDQKRGVIAVHFRKVLTTDTNCFWELMSKLFTHLP